MDDALRQMEEIQHIELQDETFQNGDEFKSDRKFFVIKYLEGPGGILNLCLLYFTQVVCIFKFL